MKRPDTVRVGPFDYRIEWVDGSWALSSDRYGETDLPALTIKIFESLPPARLSVTFLHEITHAGWDALGYEHGEVKYSAEAVAEFAGKFWPGFWRDNPEAFDWWIGLVKGREE